MRRFGDGDLLGCWKNSCQGGDGRADDGHDEQDRRVAHPALHARDQAGEDRAGCGVGEKEAGDDDEAGTHGEEHEAQWRNLPVALNEKSNRASAGTL
jgi:hypothetical protein